MLSPDKNTTTATTSRTTSSSTLDSGGDDDDYNTTVENIKKTPSVESCCDITVISNSHTRSSSMDDNGLVVVPNQVATDSEGNQVGGNL